jgi:DNA end-binding protein Ku
MPARAMSSAVVTFGLVNIPVKLYSTGESSGSVSFNLLHKKCSGRLKQQYHCPRDEEIVPREDMVKGYEFAKDQYVIFSEEELKAIEEASSKAIEITEFVPASKVDPVYFDRAYYLGPDKGAERAFRLLGEAMKQTGQAAVARYSARGKQNLVLLRPMEHGLVMQQLKYADEVKPLSEVPIGEADLKDAELTLAKQFVNQLATQDFKPEKYEDEHAKKLQAIIQQKVEGQAISIVPMEEPKAQIIDLMEALKASLAQTPAASAANAGTQEEERKPPKRAAEKVKDTGKSKAGGEKKKSKG